MRTYGLMVGIVDGPGDSEHTVGRAESRGRGEELGRVAGGDRHGSAVLDQRIGDGEADSPRGPGDDGGTIAEVLQVNLSSI
jgi:hypothetical protein